MYAQPSSSSEHVASSNVDFYKALYTFNSVSI
jgi:hypothetical protein